MTREEILSRIAEHQAAIRDLRAQLDKQRRDPLTVAFCKAVEHSGKATPDRYTAGPGGHGLVLHVKASGAKSWIQRITLAGRRCDVGLGPFPQVSLGAARDAAFENRRIARGGGTREELMARLVRPGGQVRKAPGEPTLAEAGAAVIAVQKTAWKAGGRTEEAWQRSFATFPRLARLPVGRIEAPAILECVEPHWGTRRRAMDDLLTRLSVVFRWAMAKGHRADDPVPAVRATLPRNGKHKGSFAALPHAELGAALRAVRDDPRRAAALALELVVLTACRSGEVRGARWEEVDFEAKTWTIPAERMKAGAAHVVPLSGRAVEVLAEARALGGGGDLVFTAPRGGPLWDSSVARVLQGAAPGATVHGLRSSFRDWAAESGVSREVAEAALAHKVGGVEGAYYRTRHLAERAEVMERWAAYLAGPDTREEGR